jgi:hypothetical protein
MIHNGHRVYVAGPYSKGNLVINSREAIKAGERLWKLGYVPFVPHLTLLWEVMFPHEYQDWLDYDNEWLKTCHALLRLPGESNGADAEEELARGLEIPVFHSIEDLHSAFQAV